MKPSKPPTSAPACPGVVRSSTPAVQPARHRPLFWVLVLLALGVLGLTLGVTGGAASAVVSEGMLGTGQDALQAWLHDPVLQQIVWQVRLPRSLGAWLGGALLGLAGALAQGLFRNPLADPYLLGSASGATLGVSLYLCLALYASAAGADQLAAVAATTVEANVWADAGSLLAPLGLTGAAFVGAWLAVLLTLALARGAQHSLRLLLAGVVVGVVLGALASLLALLQPQALAALQSFMWGSTAWMGWPACAVLAGVLALVLPLACSQARVLDALTLGEATAQSLGMPLRSARWLLLAVLSLSTAAAVAQMGLIAFVGLAAPHAVRSLLRCTNASALLLSACMGGALLLLADVLARHALAPQELPVGVLTAVLGGAYLLWRMHRTQGEPA